MEGSQITHNPTFQGWYPDANTGVTHFWDGQRWTGDTRPPRRPYAAVAAHRGWGITLIIFGVLFVFTSPSQLTDPSDANTEYSPLTMFIISIFLGLALLAWGIYLSRGQGPTTKAVLGRLAEQRALNSNFQAQPQPAASVGGNTIQINIERPADNSLQVAQVAAIADPQTAAALQNLQNLLYTRTITDDEFQAAKNRLLGDS